MKKVKLNLPKTKFLMKGNLINKEKEIIKEWENNNIYNFIDKKTKNNKKKFTLHDGPPYANGNIHIGNILNKVIKDILLKSKRLSGFYCKYIPGWDCHGLPIELKIFKNNLNFDNKIEIFSKCRKYVNNQIKNQKEDFIKLGIIADWKNYYYTMNFKYQYNILKTFNKLYKLGYIEAKYKPVYWCIKCQSTVSEFEILYNNIIEETIYFSFNIYKDNIFYNKNIFINKKLEYKFIIWTTTPWTIFDNEGISININIIYIVIKINKNYFIISKNSMNNILKKMNIFNYEIIEEFIGNCLLNIKIINNINNKIFNIISDDNISDNIGTGIVHVAPGHSIDDYELGLINKLNIKNSINELGFYDKNICIKYFYKKNIFNSLNKIIKFLKYKNIFIFKNNINHKYPFCYRHNQKIIFRLIFQWFIKLNHNNLKNKCINNFNNINFIPKWGKDLIINMLRNRKDWCISRQRVWGVPIAIFIDNNNNIHPNTYSILNKISKLIKKNGSEVWLNIKNKDFNINEKYKKVYDVLDVWFDSGISFINYINDYDKKIKEYDICIEGIDQFRGWFMSSAIIFYAINNNIPYKSVLFHKFILDKSGNKISKSLNNNTFNINNYSSDIIRLYISSNNYEKDILFSKESINNIIELYKKIRNTIRYIISNTEDIKKNKIINDENNLLIIDLWFLNKIKNIQKNIIYNYNNNKFYLVIDIIKNFIYKDLSLYIDIIKDRLYTSKKKSINRISAQTVLFHLINSFLNWLFPIISFTTYEAYKYINKKKFKNIFVEKWNKIDIKNNFNNLKIIISNKFWKYIFDIKYEINKVIDICKKKNMFKNTLEIHLIIYIKNNIYYNFLINFFINDIKNVFITSKIFILNKSEDTINNCIYEYKNDNLDIYIIKDNYIKCKRCWNFYDKYNFNIFKNKNYCMRCIININSINGEIRYLS